MSTNALPERHRALLTKPPGIGVLGTIGPDGFPQLSAMGFLLDDDGTIRMSALATRKKVENLRRNQQCSLFVFDPETPFRYVEARGRATVEPDVGYVFLARISAAHGHPAEPGKAPAWDPPGSSRVVITLDPVLVWAGPTSTAMTPE